MATFELKTVPFYNKDLKRIHDLKLKLHLKKNEKRLRESVAKLASSKILLTEEVGFLEAEGMEKTFKFTQEQIVKSVDIQSASKSFDLKLQYGPYCVDYTKNGKHLLIGGSKGHVAGFDWKTGKLRCEVDLKEKIYDAKWLHNENMFAVAQKKYVYVYDGTGMELHILRHHLDATRLEFLPYHFLLVSVGKTGILRYQDTSTGQLVAEHKTKLGKCDTMVQNPYNAVIYLGHSNGTVTLWSPTMGTPLVKMLCHRGQIASVAIDSGGYHMVTAGLDNQLKVWDIRTYKPIHQYFTVSPAHSLSISQRGLLAVGHGPHITVWKDALRTKQTSPYLSHLFPADTVRDLQFCPYEDILGVGYGAGVSSLIIPGAGEPNFDTFEANPFQTRKQRQESEVKSLLDKIQPEMIMLNPEFIGVVDRTPSEALAYEKRLEAEVNNKGEEIKVIKKSRGKNSAAKRYLRKRPNVIDAKKMAIKEKLEKERRQRELATNPPEEWNPLDRFKKKN